MSVFSYQRPNIVMAKRLYRLLISSQVAGILYGHRWHVMGDYYHPELIWKRDVYISR